MKGKSRKTKEKSQNKQLTQIQQQQLQTPQQQPQQPTEPRPRLPKTSNKILPRAKTKEKSYSKRRLATVSRCHRRCNLQIKHNKHFPRNSRINLARGRQQIKVPLFRAKGKVPKGMKTIDSYLDPENYTVKQITTFYKVPGDIFKTEDEVAQYNRFKIFKDTIIGRGSFATVYLAKNLDTEEAAACKILELGDGKQMKARLDEVKTELLIMELISNPFAIRVYLHYMIGTRLYIYMMYAELGSLGEYLKKNITLTEAEAKKIFAMMCAGVEHLHDVHIAHRDIKPDNFLMSTFDSRKLVMVSDYGLSIYVRKNDQGYYELVDEQCGTPAFMAPEIFKADLYPYDAFLTDIWALGVSLYMMICGMVPFDYNKVDYGLSDMENRRWAYTWDMREDPTRELDSIIRSMIEPEVSKRITMKRLVKHEWINQEYIEIKKWGEIIRKKSR